MPKTLDFPVKPHVRKYLNVHLGHGDYMLSTANRFGKMLFQLLRRQLKGKLHHAGTRDGCTQVLRLDLHNFPAHQYGLSEFTDYSIFHFNDFVDEILKEELFLWIKQFVNRRTTIKEVIVDFMAAYDLREEDIQYETLRKAVQRNVKLPELKKRRVKSVVNLSQKTADLSQKTADLSRKKGEMSRGAQHKAVRQELTKHNGSLTDFIRQHNGAALS